MIKALENRQKTLLMLSQLFSSIGVGIASYGITWLMLSLDNGIKVMGVLTLIITIFSFLITPYVGIIVDKYSRKKIYLILQLFSFFTIISTILYTILFKEHYNFTVLIIMELTASIYYTFSFPILYAFIQETYEENQYKNVNSLIETTSQTASLLAGGLAGIFLGKISYTGIFIFYAFSFLVSFFLFLPLSYKKKIKKVEKRVKSRIKDLKDGFNYLKQIKWLFIFLLSLMLPFLIVMVLNYLIPIFIQTDLKQESNFYGISTLVASLGALIGVLLYPKLSSKFGDIKTALLYVVIFTLALVLTAQFPFAFIFLLLNMFRGFGHGGAKVARRTIMMKTIPNNIMGRVDSFFSSIGLLVRILLLSGFTLYIESVGTNTLFWVLASIMIVAFVFLVVSIKQAFGNNTNTLTFNLKE